MFKEFLSTHHSIGLSGSVFSPRHPRGWSAERSSSMRTSHRYPLVEFPSFHGSFHGGLPLIHSSRLQSWYPGLEFLVDVHERVDQALEEDYEAKRVAEEIFETWEREHSDTFKR